MDSWHEYPKIFALGHAAISDLLTGSVIVQEKIDGSQFSFGVDEGGVVYIKSKGAVIHPEAPPKMFQKAVDTVLRLKNDLRSGFTYRGEVLDRPKHNMLAYDRTPIGNVIIFDINYGEEAYLDRDLVIDECTRLGLEWVPTLMVGVIGKVEELTCLLDRTSILGGPKIEGVVIKPLHYDLYGRDKKVIMGKYVSEHFKEIHKSSWVGTPSGGDVIQVLVGNYATEARWEKAIQHLRDEGRLEDDPKDIGPLLKEVNVDVLKECEAQIKEELFKWAWPQVSKGLVRGFPAYYKAKLMERQFDGTTE